MQVPDEVRKCVAFVYRRLNGRYQLAGTAFFLGEQFNDIGHGWGLSVTARHVIDGIRRVSDDQKVYLRMNSKGGGTSFIESDVEDWILHPSGPTVDVAVLPWVPELHEFDQLVYGLNYSVTEQVLQDESIGVGDDLFITGLFVHHHGAARNIPIVRVGNIAAMPAEPIRTEVGPIDAYLIEARSIGGLSGSPVFVHLGLYRTAPDGSGFTFGRIQIYLLGLMHGHFDEPVSTEDEQVDDDFVADDGLSRQPVNTGIGIVVPIGRVLDLIQSPEMQAIRTAEIELARSPGGGAVLDAAGHRGARLRRVAERARRVRRVSKEDSDERNDG